MMMKPRSDAANATLRTKVTNTAASQGLTSIQFAD
jgi:hypothetical protein